MKGGGIRTAVVMGSDGATIEADGVIDVVGGGAVPQLRERTNTSGGSTARRTAAAIGRYLGSARSQLRREVLRW